MIRAVLDRIEALTDHPHPHPPVIYDAVVVCDREGAEPTTPAPREAPSFDIAGEERLLQGIMDKVLTQGVWVTCACRLRGQELVEIWPSIRLAVMAALSCQECERAAGAIKAAITKVLAKCK